MEIIIEDHNCFGDYGCKNCCQSCNVAVECYEQKNKKLIPTP